MSTLFLLRHGKASPRGEDYDVLSEIGVRQAELLGERLARRGQRFDAVCSGPLERHRATFRAMARAASQCGVSWPEPTFVNELDEAPFVHLTRISLMQRLPDDPALQRLVARLGDSGASGGGAHRDENVLPILRHMAGLWMSGEVREEGLESYPEFSQRIDEALRAIVAASRPEHDVAIVSSFGAISELLRHALAEGAADTLGRLDAIANASVTELVHEEGSFRLLRVGDVEHLPDPDLVTFI